MEYNGITLDSLFLLAENRFRDSKPFYEEHKEQLKNGIIVPMRQIAGIFAEELLAVDPLINSIPTKMVSRIRRDTRFTKDKRLYRENCWIMFMRPKDSWRGYPCIWFEISPTDYGIGIGFYGEEAGLMETFRKNLRERDGEFRKAVSDVLSTGSDLMPRMYKRGFAGAPEGLEEYYNCKSLGFIKYSDSLKDLETDKIIEIIREAINGYTEMYKFLLSVSDEYFSKEN